MGEIGNSSCNAVMLDIETLSTHRTRALIVSWCATMFNVRDTLHQHDGPLLGLSHHGFPSLRQQLSLQRVVDLGTVQFWARQPTEARDAWANGFEKSVKNACDDLALFVGDRELWAHGIGFDVTNVETLFEEAGIPIRWKYNEVWDERTITRKNTVKRHVPKHMRDGLVLHKPEDDNITAILNLWERTDKLDGLGE